MVDDTGEQYRERIEKQEVQEGMPSPEEKENQEAREAQPIQERPAQEEKEPQQVLPQLTKDEEEEAQKEAKGMGGLAQEGKLDRLLSLVEIKGLSFAKKVLENMDSRDAFIVDGFHDTLARDERYKGFLGK